MEVAAAVREIKLLYKHVAPIAKMNGRCKITHDWYTAEMQGLVLWERKKDCQRKKKKQKQNRTDCLKDP